MSVSEPSATKATSSPHPVISPETSIIHTLVPLLRLPTPTQRATWIFAENEHSSTRARSVHERTSPVHAALSSLHAPHQNALPNGQQAFATSMSHVNAPGQRLSALL